MTQPTPTLAALVQHWLGTDRISHLEAAMATAREQLDTLNGKVDDLIADVRAARDTLAAERENLTAEGQAAFDTLSAKVDAFDAEIGDADGSDTPAGPVDGTVPVEPVEGTNP
jgi:outer membrane murein-binding lipoprotein Lpp